VYSGTKTKAAHCSHLINTIAAMYRLTKKNSSPDRHKNSIDNDSTIISDTLTKSETSSTVRRRTMEKWCIPDSPHCIPPEISLMERLIFVRYRKRYWWPAILYKNYGEVQQEPRLWGGIRLSSRIELASLTIFSPTDPRASVPVAKLLARPSVEFVEINNAKEKCEFHSKLPQVLPYACDAGVFVDNPDLYYDWHKAMDQVELLLKDFFGKHFALAPADSSTTWLARARAAEQKKWAENQPMLASWCQCACAVDSE
jgi:hypothetical protein